MERKTRDIRLSVTIKASPRKVYGALTSARALCRWWLEGAETDAKNMGRFRLVWPKIKTSDGNVQRLFPPHAAKGEVRGVFTDLEEGKKISWILDVSPKWKYPPLSSFFIEARGRSSEVTVIQSGFPTRPGAEKHFIGARLGWEDCLCKLKLYLETGKSFKHQALNFKSLKTLAQSR